MDVDVQKLNEKLKICFNIDFSFGVSELEYGDNVSTEYLALCSDIVARLKSYPSWETVIHGQSKSFCEVIASVPSVKLAFSEPFAPLKLLQYLITVLQAARLRKYAEINPQEQARIARRGKILYELDKVARHIGFTVNQSMSPVEAISAAKAEIKMYFHENTPGPESNMDKIFMSTLLSPQQLSTLLSINEAFYTDFSLRRRMLLKRQDVTIKSFLWGERAAGKSDEIEAAVHEQRQYVSDIPTKFTVDDALHAPVALILDQASKVTMTTRATKASLVKSVLIGAVPDRGGRVGGESRFSQPSKTGGGGGGRERGGGGYQGKDRGSGGVRGQGQGGTAAEKSPRDVSKAPGDTKKSVQVAGVPGAKTAAVSSVPVGDSSTPSPTPSPTPSLSSKGKGAKHKGSAGAGREQKKQQEKTGGENDKNESKQETKTATVSDLKEGHTAPTASLPVHLPFPSVTTPTPAPGESSTTAVSASPQAQTSTRVSRTEAGKAREGRRGRGGGAHKSVTGAAVAVVVGEGEGTATPGDGTLSKRVGGLGEGGIEGVMLAFPPTPHAAEPSQKPRGVALQPHPAQSISAATSTAQRAAEERRTTEAREETAVMAVKDGTSSSASGSGNCGVGAQSREKATRHSGKKHVSNNLEVMETTTIKFSMDVKTATAAAPQSILLTESRKKTNTAPTAVGDESNREALETLTTAPLGGGGAKGGAEGEMCGGGGASLEGSIKCLKVCVEPMVDRAPQNRDARAAKKPANHQQQQQQQRQSKGSQSLPTPSTGSLTFDCRLCTKKFNSLDTIEKHCQSKHGVSWACPGSVS